jgi:hypothetical protein
MFLLNTYFLVAFLASMAQPPLFALLSSATRLALTDSQSFSNAFVGFSTLISFHVLSLI